MYNRLKDLREDMDMNQEEEGKIIGTSACYYGAYEKGKRDIPFERVIKLAEYYNVSLDYIAGRSNDKGRLHSKSEIEKMWEELNKDDQEEIRALIEYKLRRKKREKERKSAV